MDGQIKFHVTGQDALPKWQQGVLRNALANGEGGSQALRKGCRIAQDAEREFDGIELGGETFDVNPKAGAQFGRDSRGAAFLTVSLIRRRDDRRFMVRFEGDGVPRKMQEVAVKHDEGRRVAPTVVALDLGAAVFRDMGPGARVVQPTKEQKRASAERRARGEGSPANRPTYGRLCAADLAVAQ